MSWISAVIDHAQESSDGSPSTTAIVAVAAVRADFANPDGTSCYPAQSTVAARAGMTRRAVIAVDQWLVDRELLTFARHRARGVKEYRLTIPRCEHSGTTGTGSDVNTAAQLEAAGPESAARQLRASCASEFTQPPTSERREEVEEARSVVADAPTGEPSQQSVKLARKVGEQAGVMIDATPVAHAIDQLRADRPDWTDDTIVTLVAKRAAQAKTNPTAYTVGAVARLIGADVVLPSRLRAMNALDLIDAALVDIQRWASPEELKRVSAWSVRRGVRHIEDIALDEHDAAQSLDEVIETCSDEDALHLAHELEAALTDLRTRFAQEAA